MNELSTKTVKCVTDSLRNSYIIAMFTRVCDKMSRLNLLYLRRFGLSVSNAIERRYKIREKRLFKAEESKSIGNKEIYSLDKRLGRLHSAYVICCPYDPVVPLQRLQQCGSC
jgi:hypothetical protein